MITIIDYGMGNLGSVLNMFKKIGVQAQATSSPKEIDRAVKILLPGVGAFDNAMKRIKELQLKEVLDKKALQDKIPVLGICLGMQLLTNSSEEGSEPGLGWIPGKTIKFRFSKEENLKIPHMGWNLVSKKNESPLTEDFDKEARFYFVHSYYVKVENPLHSILTTSYGHEFDSGIQKDNIFGAQFHPEKSHRFGMKLFENFARIPC